MVCVKQTWRSGAGGGVLLERLLIVFHALQLLCVRGDDFPPSLSSSHLSWCMVFTNLLAASMVAEKWLQKKCYYTFHIIIVVGRMRQILPSFLVLFYCDSPCGGRCGARGAHELT